MSLFSGFEITFFLIVLHGVYVLGFKVAFVFMDCYYKNLIEYQKKQISSSSYKHSLFLMGHFVLFCWNKN